MRPLVDKAREAIDKEFHLCMVIGQDIANQRKELEEKYEEFHKELHKKLEVRIPRTEETG